MKNPKLHKKPVFRNLSVKPKVQFKLVVFAVLVAGLALLPLAFLDSWLIDAINTKLGLMEPRSAITIQEVLLQFKERLLWAYSLSLLLVVATSLIGGWILTHKMVGPVFKLMQFLRRVAAGETPPPFKLRDKDSFREDLEPLVNAAYVECLARRKMIANPDEVPYT